MPEQATPYLNMLGRTGYPTLHVENLLMLIGYWASVVGFIEGLSEECLAINVFMWDQELLGSGTDVAPSRCF